jgi:hypothetical protein
MDLYSRRCLMSACCKSRKDPVSGPSSAIPLLSKDIELDDIADGRGLPGDSDVEWESEDDYQAEYEDIPVGLEEVSFDDELRGIEDLYKFEKLTLSDSISSETTQAREPAPFESKDILECLSKGASTLIGGVRSLAPEEIPRIETCSDCLRTGLNVTCDAAQSAVDSLRALYDDGISCPHMFSRAYCCGPRRREREVCWELEVPQMCAYDIFEKVANVMMDRQPFTETVPLRTVAAWHGDIPRMIMVQRDIASGIPTLPEFPALSGTIKTCSCCEVPRWLPKTIVDQLNGDSYCVNASTRLILYSDASLPGDVHVLGANNNILLVDTLRRPNLRRINTRFRILCATEGVPPNLPWITRLWRSALNVSVKGELFISVHEIDMSFGLYWNKLIAAPTSDLYRRNIEFLSKEVNSSFWTRYSFDLGITVATFNTSMHEASESLTFGEWVGPIIYRSDKLIEFTYNTFEPEMMVFKEDTEGTSDKVVEYHERINAVIQSFEETPVKIAKDKDELTSDEESEDEEELYTCPTSPTYWTRKAAESPLCTNPSSMIDLDTEMGDFVPREDIELVVMSKPTQKVRLPLPPAMITEPKKINRINEFLVHLAEIAGVPIQENPHITEDKAVVYLQKIRTVQGCHQWEDALIVPAVGDQSSLGIIKFDEDTQKISIKSHTICYLDYQVNPYHFPNDSLTRMQALFGRTCQWVEPAAKTAVLKGVKIKRLALDVDKGVRFPIRVKFEAKTDDWWNFPADYEAHILKMNPRSRKNMFTAFYNFMGFATTFDDKKALRFSFFVKSDDKVSKPKARAIHYVPKLPWLKFVAKFDKVAHTLKMNRVWTCRREKLRFVYCCGISQKELGSIATTHSISEEYRLVFACGDDNTSATAIDDFRMYDSTQTGTLAEMQATVLKQLGFTEEEIFHMFSFHSQLREATGVKIHLNRISLPSGALWTLFLGTIGNFLFNLQVSSVTHLTKSKSVTTQEIHTTAARLLGLDVTFEEPVNFDGIPFYGNDFLKGVFIPLLDSKKQTSRIVWVPLPSRIIKWSARIVKNLEAGHLTQTAMWSHLKAVALGQHPFLLDPLCRAWVDKWRKINVKAAHLPPRFRPMDETRDFEEINDDEKESFRSRCATIFTHRYNLGSQSEYWRMVEQIGEPNHNHARYPRNFAKLWYRDYGGTPPVSL